MKDVNVMTDLQPDAQKVAAVAPERFFQEILNHNDEAVQAYIASGNNVNVANEKGDTPLHAAALIGDMRLVQQLLDAGANANARNDRHQLPLHTAKAMKYAEIAALLETAWRQQGAVPKFECNWRS